MSTAGNRAGTAGHESMGLHADKHWRLKRNLPLWLMLAPGLVYVLIFSYTPMYGAIIAFQDFKPIHGFLGSEWVGLKWFRRIFAMPDSYQLLRNTFIIAVGKIVLGQIAGIVFALLLYELRSDAFRKVVHNFTYLPSFLSWVILGGIFREILSLDGAINQILSFFKVSPIFFLGSNDWFRTVLILTDTWKGFGMGAILYLAALTAIDPQLYDNARVDGAGKLREIWSITLPGISPTIILLAVLSLGNVLNAGFQQVLMLYNPLVYATGDILDTWIYRAGILGAQFSLGAAVGLFRSLFGFGMIILAHFLAHRLTGYRIF